MKWSIVAVFIVLGIAAVGVLLAGNQGTGTGFQPGIGGGPQETNQQDMPLIQRGNLHRLLQEHALIANLHLQTLYNGEDTSDTRRRLGENTQDLAQLMSDLSETDVRNEFLTVWQGHIQEYERYTVGVRESDQSQMELARQNLAMHSREFGEVVERALPAVSSENAAAVMQEHVNLTLSIVDAHADDDMSAKLTQSTKASAQAATFAEVLVPDQENQ